MKTKIITLIFAAALALGASAQVPRLPQGGPGIAIAGSQQPAQLPEKAQKFLKKHFKDQPVVKCERYFAKDRYEVELANGVDVDFDIKGNPVEVDAPSKSFLPVSVVEEFLPHKAYKRLADNGYASQVESLEFKRGKTYEVELGIPDPDTYIFDIVGEFIDLED